MNLLIIGIVIMVLAATYWWLQALKARAQVSYLRTALANATVSLQPFEGAGTIPQVRKNLETALLMTE